MSRSHAATSGDMVTLVDLLSWRATCRPNQLAYTFLFDGEVITEWLTYGAPDQQARATATILQQHCSPHDRGLLLYPLGRDYLSAFFGCLYVGSCSRLATESDTPRMASALPKTASASRDTETVVREDQAGDKRLDAYVVEHQESGTKNHRSAQTPAITARSSALQICVPTSSRTCPTIRNQHE